jgi:hypothetical protein
VAPGELAQFLDDPAHSQPLNSALQSTDSFEWVTTVQEISWPTNVPPPRFLVDLALSRPVLVARQQRASDAPNEDFLIDGYKVWNPLLWVLAHAAPDLALQFLPKTADNSARLVQTEGAVHDPQTAFRCYCYWLLGDAAACAASRPQRNEVALSLATKLEDQHPVFVRCVAGAILGLTTDGPSESTLKQ